MIVDIWSDVVCPWCYLGKRLASKYGMSVPDVDATQRQMTERARLVGLDFRLENQRSGNTRDAHRLLQLAKARHRQPALMERLHRAYFTEQVSIFDDASLTALAVDVGLDAGEVHRVLGSDDYADDLEADETTARSLGVTGVPFFVIDRRFAISGAQPAEVIVRALDHAWAEAARSSA